jgi:hypothetical protein
MERIDDGDSKGQIKFSFRNLLALHRPLVIVDEAHNNTSPLSFEKSGPTLRGVACAKFLRGALEVKKPSSTSSVP